MNKPRVAILHYSAPPTIGGVESTISTHARLFTDHGYPVQVIAGRGEAFDPRVEFTCLPQIDSRDTQVEAIQKELNAGVVPAAFAALRDTLTRQVESALQATDVLIVHNAVTLHKNLALTAALDQFSERKRVRFIAWCHDFAWDDPVYAADLHSGLPWDLLRQPWANVQYVVVSDARRVELARLLELAPSQIAVVPPGIDPSEFLGVTPLTAQWIEQFGLLDTAPLLLLPARVTRRKNIELAIEITAMLQTAGLHPKLLVMGPLGPHNPKNRAYWEELKRRAANMEQPDAILFLQEYGAVSDAARRDLYALADALLFPSAREGFGIPILEAGLARLPIFCADLPPFRESAGELAYYFALDESPAQIANRMMEFFRRDSRYQLKQRVVQTYSWNRIFTERIEPLVNL